MFLALLACGATDERSADVWTPSVRVDADGDGYSPDAGDRADCDDADPNNHPTAVEVCDGEDDDCDGEIDEGLTNIYYPDADHDGYGDPTLPLAACAPPEDHAANADDCDDLNADVHPDRQEVCNTADDDCDGRVDEDPTDGSEWYDDVDGDGHGAGYTRVLLCYVPDDRVPLDDDCDDSDAAVHPGAPEVCNGVDDDCDGSRPTDEVDNDRDSQLACDGDCDDADATIWFGGVEDCDDGISGVRLRRQRRDDLPGERVLKGSVPHPDARRAANIPHAEF